MSRRPGLAAIVALLGFLAAACGGTSADTAVLGTSHDHGSTSVATTTSTATSTTIAPSTTAVSTTAPTTTAASAPIVAPAAEAPPTTVRAVIPLNIGASEMKVTVAGVERSYVAVVPPPTGKTRSLVVFMHGVGGRGAQMRSLGFENLAAATGTVFVYPDGLGGFWNDERPGADPTPAPPISDEIAFLQAIIDEMVARAGVEPQRVALGGFSNGAIMAARASCDLADGIAAIAVIGGTGGAGYGQICQPKRPVSVLVVAGTNDPVVPFNGGQVADYAGRKRGRVEPVGDFINFWARKCECAAMKETAVNAAMKVSKVEAQTCMSDTSVVLFRVQGGHEWFRMNGFDTTKVVWDFLSDQIVA